MKIAIDLNDVIRDFSNNFVRYYIEGYDRNYDLNGFEFWTNDLSILLPFKSKNSYNNFVYNDYAFELFGKCSTTTRGLETELNTWTEQTLKDLDIDEEVEVIFVSPMEYGLSIGNTYFFISKLGTKVREVFMPIDSIEIWDKCDVLITANPNLLNNKPDSKITIKIKTEYNNDCSSNYSYNSLSDFLKNNKNTENLISEILQK
jgi:hypothetical protein